MKFKPLILSIAVLMAISLSACDSEKVSSQSTESTSSTTSSTTSVPSSTKKIEYNGTFNEEVFNQIAQNIKIGDKTIALPCTFGDFGEGYQLGENQVLQEDVGLSSNSLLYKDSIIGYITIKYTDGDENTKDNEITGISFSYSDFKKQTNFNCISVGGITFQDTKSKVMEQFGEPLEQHKFSSGTISFNYKTNSKDNLYFNFDDNEQVTKMEITFPTN